MNSYRFMYLEEAFLPGPTPRHAKRLQPIRPEIPEKLASKLDDWGFDRDQDRDRNPVEWLAYESIRSQLRQLLNTWEEELRQCDDPDHPDWAQLGVSRNLLGKVGFRIAPESQNGMVQRVYLVRNPPDREGTLHLRRPQD